jgi:hypothetical protein
MRAWGRQDSSRVRLAGAGTSVSKKIREQKHTCEKFGADIFGARQGGGAQSKCNVHENNVREVADDRLQNRELPAVERKN